MSAMDPRAKRIVDRVVNTYRAHGENGDAYLLVAFSMLASSAPDAAEFILDRADDAARKWKP